MTEIMLSGALNALKTKIEALAASDAATAEDLAMLGTALERIAGKTTAIEVQMIGESERAATAADALEQRTSTLAAISDAVTSAETAVGALAAQIASDVGDAQTAIDTASSTAISDVASARTTALDAIATGRDDAIADVNSAAATAITTASGLSATSFFFNQL